MNQEERQLIDRYLENSLTGLELKEFHDRLESDSDFRNKVSFHNLLIEGIQQAEDKRLALEIEKSIGFQRPLIPIALKLIVTFIIITAGGIILWNYTGPDSGQKNLNYFSLNIFRDKKQSNEQPVVADKNATAKKDLKKSIVQKSENKTSVSRDSEKDSVAENNSPSEEIVVKKDQLLISVMLKSTEIDQSKTDENSSEKSEAKNASEKLNPEGGLPESEAKPGLDFNVEFWVSPVNYKGYRLIADKLILFGIEQPDAVQLFSSEKKLWMKYGKELYSLERSDNFESFVNANEVPAALK